MSHIDLDMIESIVREAMDHLPPEEQKHEAIEMRCVDVLAMVRAVRAALSARDERWSFDRDDQWRAVMAHLDVALAPFRKEAT